MVDSMFVKKIATVTLAFSLVQPVFAQAAPMILTQQSVAEMVLKQGLRTKEVNIEFQQSRLAPAQVLAAYDWNLEVATGYQYNKQASLLNNSTATYVPEYESYLTTASLAKKLVTGTSIKLTLERTTQDFESDSAVTNGPPARQSWDRAGLLIEQSLLKNSFGYSDRALVNSANLTFKANEISRADNLEQVVLDSIQAFWNTYVAQENFKQAVNSRDRYKTLVDAVRRKTSLGYSNPGDLPQVQAEFEGQEQTAKRNSVEYLRNLENLATLLNLPPQTEIKLQISTNIAPVPKLESKKVEDRRRIRAQKLRVDAATEGLSAAKSDSYPAVDFVGNVYTTGQGDNADDSYSDMVGGDRPGYYAGVRLRYNFGSDIQNETIINRKLTKELEEVRLNRATLEAQDQDAQYERAAQASYAVAISAEKQKQFREKAQQELNRSYTQGRTDIQALIIAMNAFFQSEVAYVRALGDYAISLNQWAAHRDELIPDDETSANK